MIIDLQRRLSEVGRIRIGQQVASKGRGGRRPEKLDTFRLTSPDKTRIEAAARLYGGEVQPWEAPAGPQWEVITQTDVLQVVVPPTDMAFTQWYELWSGGGCQRRCDGVQESISDGHCLCDPDERECKIHTRLSVMLRDLPGLGVWRIDSSGYYAGVELQGAVEIVKLAAGRGQMLPAALRLEQRMVKRANDQTKRFAVPVLDLAVSPAQLLGGGDPLDAGTLSIESSVGAINKWGEPVMDGSGNLMPVPESVPERPTPSIAEQTAPPPARKPRKNAAKKLPSTGVKPRTAAQATRDLQAAGAGHSGDGTISERIETDSRQPDDTPPRPENPPSPGPAAEPDLRPKLGRNMHALFNTAGITDREQRLTITSYIIKRFDIESSNDLTTEQLQQVVDRMNGWDRDGTLADQVNDILNQAAVDQWQGQEGVNS